jgi:flagellar biosynthetic protein FlhB
MSEDKNEQATPKRREQAARRGQIVQSRDLSSSLVFLVMALLISLISPALWNGAAGMTRRFFYLAATTRHSGFQVDWLCGETFPLLASLLLPLCLGAILAIVMVYGLQTRFALFEERLTPSLTKLDPIRNLSHMFSPQQMLLPFLILGKVTVIVAVAYFTLRPALQRAISSLPVDDVLFLSHLWRTATLVILRTSLLMVVLGVIDYSVQWWRHEKELMMTREEVKEEYKQEEGSPQIKQKIRQRFQQLAQRRMMTKVPEAAVVITNPTTLAIAIKYRRQQMKSPQVVAKGMNEVAARIRIIAREHGIPLIEDKPLARAMYKTVEIGHYVPPQFFQAVATILAYVYRQAQQHGRNVRVSP